MSKNHPRNTQARWRRTSVGAGLHLRQIVRVLIWSSEVRVATAGAARHPPLPAALVMEGTIMLALNLGEAWYNFAVAKRLDTRQQLEHVDEHLSEVATKLSRPQLGKLEAAVSKIPLPSKQQQNAWMDLAAKSP